MPTTLERCNAPADLLHEAVRLGLGDFRDALEAAGRSLPGFVHRELEAFVGCGDPANGFAWLHCERCDHHRLVPFTCQGRGFCSSCGGRRMAATAARWCDEVFPRVATRQWVITLPWKRRWLLARRPELVQGVLRRALREVFAWYQARARERGIADPRCGAVAAQQRFGSSLVLNLHFHVVACDGVFAPDDRPGVDRIRFYPIEAPTTEEVERIVERIAERVEVWLAKQGHGADESVDDQEDGLEDGMALIQAASLEGRAAVGSRSGRRARRVQVLGGKPYALPPRCATCDGYNLHAGVAVRAQDRSGLERLLRYILRPPVAKGRLELRDDGTYVVYFKRAWSDGTKAVVLDRTELLERLAALVPPPRRHLVSYHGVFAPRSAWRSRVVPGRSDEGDTSHHHGGKLVRPDHASRSPTSRWVPWASLLWRVFGVDDAWACPHCNQRMALRTVVLPPATLDVLAGLAASAARAPPDPASIAS